MIAGQHVAHRIAPTRFANEPHRRSTARKAAVRVFVLAESRVGRSDIGKNAQRIRSYLAKLGS